MKRVLLIMVVLVFLTSCSNVLESMEEAVDKDDHTPINITIENGETINSIANKLNEKKLISTKFSFTNYLSENGLSSSLQEGKYVLKKSMTLKEIVGILTYVKPVGETVTITIPEGYEVREIANLLEKNNVVDKKSFIKVLKEEKFDYDFLKDIDRSYNLEGFLFPDTYEFFKNSDAKDVVVKFLDNFNNKFNQEMRQKAIDDGKTINDVLTLASIIEREAVKADERPIISGVFHNRIKQNMKLESCATVQFVLEERKVDLTYKDMAIDSPYNTYINSGLPPAPIANPGLSSIKASLYPQETEYLFFVASNLGDGSHYFGKTFAEHEENIQKALKNE